MNMQEECVGTSNVNFIDSIQSYTFPEENILQDFSFF